MVFVMDFKAVLLLSLALLSALAVGESNSDVVVLTSETFDARTAEGEWLLEFYAPWCGHCKSLAPIYEDLATKVKDQFNVAKIDCTQNKDLCSRFGVNGYPTIKFLKGGKIYNYNSQRTLDALVTFITEGYSSVSSDPIPQVGVREMKKEAAAASTDGVVVLTTSNFAELTQSGVWFLEFYAPWCGHCKKLVPIYDQVATQLKGQVNLGKIDCTTNSAICEQYGVKGYPTIFYQRDGTVRSYTGARSVDGFKKFAEDDWKKVTAEPIPQPANYIKSKLFSLITDAEDLLSMNIYAIVALCVLLGVALGVVVVMMVPAPAPKVIHYPADSASTVPQTEETISKQD